MKRLPKGPPVTASRTKAQHPCGLNCSVLSDSLQLWTVAYQVPLFMILQARMLEWVSDFLAISLHQALYACFWCCNVETRDPRDALLLLDIPALNDGSKHCPWGKERHTPVPDPQGHLDSTGQALSHTSICFGGSWSEYGASLWEDFQSVLFSGIPALNLPSLEFFLSTLCSLPDCGCWRWGVLFQRLYRGSGSHFLSAQPF